MNMKATEYGASPQTPVLGYVRVSKVGGREGDSFISPELQREQIESVARRDGLRVVEVIEELDASGGDANRPGWNRAIEMVERGEVEGIAVWNLSRFSRSVKDATVALDRIESAGGRVYSATEDFGPGPSGRMMRTILLAVAENERERQAEGFLASKRNAAARGIHVAGRIPLGYRRGADRRLEVDPDTAPVVQGVFQRKAKGWSHEALARWVHEHGVEGFSTTGVRWMLSNRAYLGEARGGGVVTEDAHPALVPKALFARCQARGVQSQRTGKLAGRFLLVGLGRCSGCGRGLRLSTSGDGRAFYRCREVGCPARAYAGAERLDSYVLNRVEEVLTGVDADGVRVGAGDPERWREATLVARPDGDDAAAAEAELALEEAKAELDSFLADVKLRSIVGPEKFADMASDRVAIVNKCQADLAAARGAGSTSWALVGDLWLHHWSHSERCEWLARTLRSVVVSRGREPLSRRVEVELR